MYRGKIYRNADEDGLWEISDTRPRPDHFGDWFLSRLGAARMVPVSDQDLENADLWVPVRDR